MRIYNPILGMLATLLTQGWDHGGDERVRNPCAGSRQAK